MAVAVVLDSGEAGRDVAGARSIRRGTISLGVYATNGVAVTKATFDLWHSLVELEFEPTGGYIAAWDKTNAKVLVYWQTDSDNGVALGEITDTTDITSTLFRFNAKGK